VGPPLDKYGAYISPLFVAAGLWNKGPAMAEAMKASRIERPTLSGRDVQDIVAYIRAGARREPGAPARVFARPGNPRSGATLFQAKGCAGCHAPKEGGAAAHRLGGGRLRVSLSAIASRMWNHSPGMWSRWKEKGLPPISLKPGEMADLTAYLYFLQFESPPGSAARGAALFRSRNCAACHGKKSEKAVQGPDLRTKGPWKNDLDLVREMWNHAGKMFGKMILTGYEWPRLGEREVADLLAYVRSIGGTLMEKKKPPPEVGAVSHGKYLTQKEESR
jgi:mono/diheme cytochrome c family protein